MSVSLEKCNSLVTYLSKCGCKKEEIEKSLEEHSGYMAQGDFIPKYWDKKRFSEPEIEFDMQDKTDLNLENLKKIDVVAKKRGLELLFDEAFKKAFIGCKRRFIPWPKTVIEICNSGEIIVKKPCYVIESQKGLLEEIGEIFGLKA